MSTIETRSVIPHNKPSVDQDDIEAIAAVAASGWLAQGPKVRDFERALCGYLKVSGDAVAVSSGTAALYLSLHALGVGRGDEVIVPTYSCSALLNAVYHIGATPVIADVSRHDFNITPVEVKRCLTPKTQAVIVPHMFGVPADLDEIVEIGVPVIEDCAQSIGSLYNSQPTGTNGRLAVFSFYATKLITTGYGGMVLSKDIDLIDRARDYREFDCRQEYVPRFNFQMGDLQAGMGLVQLAKLDGFVKRRRWIASQYLRGIKGSRRVIQASIAGDERNYFRFVLEFPGRDGVEEAQRKFEAAEIQTAVPIQRYELLHRYLKMDPQKFRSAEHIVEHTLSIPIYPDLSDDHVSRIVDVLGSLA